jgi:hypothetical protein
MNNVFTQYEQCFSNAHYTLLIPCNLHEQFTKAHFIVHQITCKLYRIHMNNNFFFLLISIIELLFFIILPFQDTLI